VIGHAAPASIGEAKLDRAGIVCPWSIDSPERYKQAHQPKSITRQFRFPQCVSLRGIERQRRAILKFQQISVTYGIRHIGNRLDDATIDAFKCDRWS